MPCALGIDAVSSATAFDRPRLAAALAAGLQALALALNPAQQAQLLDYLELLARWNRTYNLTAVREAEAMVTRHLLDSLVLLAHLRGDTLADLGSGAGLPGIPLAIAAPQRRVLLVESNGKKARFLRTVQRELGLTSVEVCEQRAQAGPANGVGVAEVTARALASLADLCALARPWLADNGRLLALKGPGWLAESHALPADWRIDASHQLTVPGLDAGRQLVILAGSGAHSRTP